MSERNDDSDDGDDVSPVFPSRGPNREEMASGYIPEESDWLAKTHLDINDPAAVSALSSFDQVFPEVDDLQPTIDRFLDDFLRAKTSVKGRSRDEYKSILMSMFGGGPDEGGSTAMKLVAADDDD